MARTDYNYFNISWFSFSGIGSSSLYHLSPQFQRSQMADLSYSGLELWQSRPLDLRSALDCRRHLPSPQWRCSDGIMADSDPQNVGAIVRNNGGLVSRTF